MPSCHLLHDSSARSTLAASAGVNQKLTESVNRLLREDDTSASTATVPSAPTMSGFTSIDSISGCAIASRRPRDSVRAIVPCGSSIPASATSSRARRRPTGATVRATRPSSSTATPPAPDGEHRAEIGIAGHAARAPRRRTRPASGHEHRPPEASRGRGRLVGARHAEHDAAVARLVRETVDLDHDRESELRRQPRPLRGPAARRRGRERHAVALERRAPTRARSSAPPASSRSRDVRSLTRVGRRRRRAASGRRARAPASRRAGRAAAARSSSRASSWKRCGGSALCTVDARREQIVLRPRGARAFAASARTSPRCRVAELRQVGLPEQHVERARVGHQLQRAGVDDSSRARSPTRRAGCPGAGSWGTLLQLRRDSSRAAARTGSPLPRPGRREARTRHRTREIAAMRVPRGPPRRPSDLERLDELVEVVDLDRAVAAEHRREGARRADQRTGVGERRASSRLGTSDLEADDGLAGQRARGRAPRRRRRAGGPSRGRARRLASRRPRRRSEVVGRVRDGLATRRDDAAHPDPATEREERVRDRARLADEPRRGPLQWSPAAWPIQADRAARDDDTHAVRPDHRSRRARARVPRAARPSAPRPLPPRLRHPARRTHGHPRRQHPRTPASTRSWLDEQERGLGHLGQRRRSRGSTAARPPRRGSGSRPRP